MKHSPYIQHPGKVASATGAFKHVMAVALDPSTSYKEGVIRCITSRTGDPGKSGNVDRSQIFRVRADDLEHLKLTERIQIKNEAKIIENLSIYKGEKMDFIGLEDPDLFLDESTGLLHMYMTLPFMNPHDERLTMAVHLGHAVGKSLDTMEMTEPAVTVDMKSLDRTFAKELSVAPINKQGIRLNLIESYDKIGHTHYSTVRVVRATDMGKPWEFGEVVLHPKDLDATWIAGHASPGPFLPTDFIDIGPGRRVGIMNGRAPTKHTQGKDLYGPFTIGLFIYDYENGKIDWVSPELLIQDTEAENITFASQFILTKPGEGILYAHVDDSFVRAYTLNAEGIRELLPRK